jgi:hypothetical protein
MMNLQVWGKAHLSVITRNGASPVDLSTSPDTNLGDISH